jgi:hypothetical protein
MDDRFSYRPTEAAGRVSTIRRFAFDVDADDAKGHLRAPSIFGTTKVNLPEPALPMSGKDLNVRAGNATPLDQAFPSWYATG